MYQCFQCGMISMDPDQVRKHMLTSHNIKVEEDTMTRKYFCTLCVYSIRNMNDFKTHLIQVHKKEEHNWMVEEIQAAFSCVKCSIKFSRKSELEAHLNLVHGEMTQNGKENQNEPHESIDDVEEITLNIFRCDCNICGELLTDNTHSKTQMKGHFGKSITEKEDVKPTFKLDHIDGEIESSSDEDETPPPNFVESKWGDNALQEPTGMNFKAKTSLFMHAQ